MTYIKNLDLNFRLNPDKIFIKIFKTNFMIDLDKTKQNLMNNTKHYKKDNCYKDYFS